MAAKGKAAKSSTGASMSAYDVEVEGRLKQIEADVNSLSISVANVEKALTQLQTIDDLTEALPEPEGLEARFNKLVQAVGKQIQVPKDI
jgi:hypothetical protein